MDKKEFGGALTPMVREFYRVEFWDKMRGNEINNQDVANTIFNFGVNAGMSMAVKLAQLVVGTWRFATKTRCRSSSSRVG